MAQKAKGLLKRMEWFTRVKALPERAAVSGEKQRLHDANASQLEDILAPTKGGK